MKFLGPIVGGSFGLVYMFAGPITFIVLVVDTWQSRASVPVKLLLSLTLDAFLAAIWPITWLLWAIQWMAGSETALVRVFG